MSNRLSIAWWAVALFIAISTTSLRADELPRLPPPMKVEPSKKVDVAPSQDSPPTIIKVGESPIDLATALRLAGAANPQLLLARERVTEALAIKQLAAAQSLPNINLGTNYNLHRGTLQQANGNILQLNRDALYVGLGANAVGAGTVNIPGLSYNLNIGTAWFSYLQSKQIVARSVAANRTVQNNTLFQVCSAYTDLLRAEARLAIAGVNRSEGAELVRLTEAYAKAGQGRKADADRATVELRKRDAELTQAEADTLAASARLARLLNLDNSLRLKPIDGWAVPSALVPDPVPVAELVAIALMQRPELEERRAEIQQSIYALSSAKILPFSPDVILGFSVGSFGGGSNLVSSPQGFIGGDGTQQRGSRFGEFDGRTDLDAVLTWTFQNLGVGNIAITKGAESRVRQANLRQQETINRIRAEVMETHARVQARFLQIDSSSKAVEASQNAFQQDLARIKGREGLPIEVIDSMRLLARSRYEYLDAIIDYNRFQFQLYVVVGQPPAEALVRPVPESLAQPVPVTNTPLKTDTPKK